MSGTWWAYLPTTAGESDKPRVGQPGAVRDWMHPTREAALAALRRDLERKLKASQERTAELGRALQNLMEMEES